MFKISYSSNLKGEVKISGSKNAALPIVSANFIPKNPIILNNVPDIKDVRMLQAIGHGAMSSSKDFFDLTTEDAAKIRASILLIPVGLIRFGKVKFCGSGGCKIGKRPLDTFDDGLVQAGVKVTQEEYKTYERAGKPNKHIVFTEFSVTATEALITYLAFLEDVDYDIRVSQVAIEPHVINLIDFLKNLGANITLNYDHSLVIRPSKINVQKESFDIIGDYIQAGTYLGLGAIADQSEILVKGVSYKDLISVLNLSKKIGIEYEVIKDDVIKVNSKNKKNYRSVRIQTNIFPGFPTDLQSIFGTVMTQCNGISEIFEILFEGRFSYLLELENLGANIRILNPHQAIIVGPTQLRGNYVATTDLRGGGAMVLAGIVAEGTTHITNEDIILRGYDNILDNLKSIGVNIEHI